MSIQYGSWSFYQKLSLRFFLLYFIVYMLFMFTQFIWQPIFVWVGQHVLDMSQELRYRSNGSGDDSLSYVAWFCQTVIALIGTLLWSVVDRKRKSYNHLRFWFLVTLRAFVAFFMVVYGLAKVFYIQFRDPALITLLKPVGDLSPMGLAWTYMGHSVAFSIFTGLLEVFAGLFLIPRRTKALGALMTLGVMTHVAFMNLCFDIPVKIFSIHLVLMSLYLIWDDRHRLQYAFLGIAKPTIPNFHAFKNSSFYRIKSKIKVYFLSIGVCLMFCVAGFLRYQVSKNTEIGKFYGIYTVERFIKNGDTIAPLITEGKRWRYVILERGERANIWMMDDVIQPYYIKPDSTNQFFSIYHKNEEEELNNFKISSQQDDLLGLNGAIRGDSLQIMLKKEDLSRFKLTNQPFRWINEYPDM